MERDAGHEEPSNQDEPATYAFLNHSTDTLVNKLPPDVDNKPLARQKRKRTSPEDQAVLEAAYLRDPKPDKDARLRLVEQIALGEKEVQIWFQNRRQTSRRKSRPLLPHEIAQFQMSRYGTTMTGGSEIHDSRFSDEPVATLSPNQSTQDSEDSQDLQRSSQAEASGTQASSLSIEQIGTPSFGAASQDSSIGYLANRRSLPTLSQVLNKLSGRGHEAPTDTSKHGLKKSASFVRLAMTSEGAAKVITKDSLTPSPPRPVAPTDQTTGDNVRESSPSAGHEKPRQTSLKRSASGRSRDSRAWEFWCDKDCRSELEEKAERDGKGSAADAIGMMRRKALQPLAHKQNAALSKHQPWLMRQVKPDTRRPSLQRSQTSEGRLQNPFGYAKRKRTGKLGALEFSTSVYIPGNESDKENRSPGADVSTHGQKESESLVKTKLRGSGKDDKANAENVTPESDPEIAVFMKAGRSGQQAPVDEELDCIHGLLSLSQGNWAT